MLEALSKIKEEQDRAQVLRVELEQIAKLDSLGITRHNIVKQRKRVQWLDGNKRIETGEADIIMRDGTRHIVPARLLKWNK
tara:strand:+ start:1347 stop:1589 length:243 start_codon:yes stop_codon:yes gene_type:complete